MFVVYMHALRISRNEQGLELYYRVLGLEVLWFGLHTLSKIKRSSRRRRTLVLKRCWLKMSSRDQETKTSIRPLGFVVFGGACSLLTLWSFLLILKASNVGIKLFSMKKKLKRVVKLKLKKIYREIWRDSWCVCVRSSMYVYNLWGNVRDSPYKFLILWRGRESVEGEY